MVARGGVILTLPARSVGVTINWSSMVAVLIVYLVGWSINISKELELTKKCNLLPLAVFGSALKSPVKIILIYPA